MQIKNSEVCTLSPSLAYENGVDVIHRSVILPVDKQEAMGHRIVDFRTISLILHVSKILLKILTCISKQMQMIFVD